MASASADSAISGRVLLPAAVTPSHYYIELTPDFELLTFLGNQNVSLTISEETKEITMHAKELIIESATYGEQSMNSCSYNFKHNTVTIAFEDSLPIGTGTLVLKFKGILNGDMNGFYKSSYTDAKGNKKIVASTQFESLDARLVFNYYEY